MGVTMSRSEEQQLRALGFALDRVFAPPPAPTREALEEARAAARAENRALRARVRALEHELYPDEADLGAYEREMESRLARARTTEEGISSGLVLG